MRVIREMREATNGEQPRYILFENVPGAFSSNQGNDHKTVLEEILALTGDTVSIPRPPKGKWLRAGEIVGDTYSIAWRCMDARHWGVPQRRNRIFLVADLAGGRAGEILFKLESVSGDIKPCGEKGQNAASDALGGADICGGGGGNEIHCLTTWDSLSKRVYDPGGCYPAL